MEDEGTDTTVIESRQHKMGQMADFPPLLAFPFLTHKNMMYLKLNLRPCGMN
jgi:hypothetical protein